MDANYIRCALVDSGFGTSPRTRTMVLCAPRQRSALLRLRVLYIMPRRKPIERERRRGLRHAPVEMMLGAVICAKIGCSARRSLRTFMSVRVRFAIRSELSFFFVTK